jgi:hypothetical protein
MSHDVVMCARQALHLLCRGALYEHRAGVRSAVMSDLGAVAEAVEELARLRGELAAAAEAVAGARAEAATVARTMREEVALLRARLELAERRAEEATDALGQRVGA